MDANSINPENEPLQYPAKWITGKEMILILKNCGAKVREFADYCSKSENFIRQSLGHERYVSIPLLYIDRLSAYVGEDNMKIGLQTARNYLHERYKVNYIERMRIAVKDGGRYRA